MSALALIVALPLCGFLVNGLFGSRLPKQAVAVVACVLPALAFAQTCRLFLRLGDGAAVTETLFTWVALPDLTVDAALYFDAIAAVMCLVVTGVGTLIHVYSIGYMWEDKSFARYFAYLNLFLFFMLLLVLGANLVVVFVGWEGVGLALYLLIGFWFTDPEKTAAGLKAFVVNRVGDLGFILAAFLLYTVVGSLDFPAINAFFANPPAANAPSAALTTTIALLLFLGACGKSAQIPLHVWLPDAMAGPTPVSALIHAATMVTAGVYLLARLSGLYLASPAAMSVVAWTGALTALLGATMAVTQFNLKKVLAYSTISQIGLMVLACGVGAFSVALFHLVTHAFFKACLFLGAGAVLHALQGEEDMRNMGALAKKLPVTFVTFVVAAIALSGIPPFAGFFSKDEILWSAWSTGSPALWLTGLAASALTAFYIFRAVFLTFLGESRVPANLAPHVHEAPRSMASVLVVLALGAALIGFIGLPKVLADVAGVAAPFHDFLARVLPPVAGEHHAVATELLLMAVAVLAALAGIGLAWSRFGRGGERALAHEPRGYAYGIASRGYLFDAFYDMVVRCMDRLSVLARGPEALLAKITLDKSADAVRSVSTLFARLQTGNVQAYALYVLLGLALTLWWGAIHA